MNTWRRGLTLVLCSWTLAAGLPPPPAWAQRRPPRPGPVRPPIDPRVGPGDVVVRPPGGAVLPLPPRVAFFPENERRRPLTDTVSYCYETCEAIDADVLRGKQRVSFAQLGVLGNVLHVTMPNGGTCAPGDCYLRVIAASLGGALTLRGNDPVPCEDPDSGDLGECRLGMASVGAAGSFARPDRYRGNVVLADTIRVEGTVELGGLDLVLVARRGIEVAPGAVIRGAAAAAKPAPPPLRGTSQNECVPQCVRWLRNHGPRDAEPICQEESERCKQRWTAVPNGQAGAAGDPSGSLVLVAPTLTVHPTGAAPQVVLEGQPGGPGGIVAPLECERDDDLCRSSAETAGRTSRSGAGGAGGAAGTLVLVAKRIAGGALQSSLRGGAGGASGVLLRRLVRGEATANRDLGTRGAAGVSGSNGTRQEARLGDAGYDYAYFLGARGAERLLLNSRYYARFVHPAQAAASGNDARARGALQTLLANYCRPAGLLASIDIPPQGSEPVPSGPATYVPAATPQARRAVCREAETRLANLDAGRNWFGLPTGYYLYVRPDVVAGYRNQLLAETDGVRAGFQALARGQQALLDLAATERDVLAEKEKRVAIAELRYRTLVEAAMTKLGWVELNSERLADLNTVLNDSANAVNAALQAPDCNLLCVFGNLLDIAINIVSFIGGVVSAVSSTLDFISSLGPIFNKSRILGELRSTGKISMWNIRESPFDDIQIFATYAKAVFKGAKINGEEIGGVADIGGKVKETVEAWKTTAAAVAGPDDVAGLLHSITFNNAAAERELHNALGRVQVAIATVEGLDASDVVNKSEALGRLRLMATLLEERIDLTRQSSRLVGEHMLALAEVPIAEHEVELARLERDQTRDRIHQLQCRAGELRPGDCAGIAAAAAAEVQAVRRDRACEAGRRLGDATLLFDFYYQRARDFVLLVDRGNAADSSHDFQRQLLDERDRLAFGGAVADAIHDDFIQVLQGQRHDVVLGDYCLPGRDCGSGTVSDDDSAQRDVIAGLLRTGRTTFDPAADCRPGDRRSRCLPFLAKEAPRQRVLDVRVELVTAPGYRLGCTSATSCPAPPAGNPPDQPLANMQHRVRFRHDELATFLWDDGGLKSFLLPRSHPRQACEIARTFSGSPTDCSAVIDFSGQSVYSAGSTYAHDGPFDLAQAFSAPIHDNAALFGTSVRGSWYVDLAGTLAQLNGESGDACYRFHPANPAFQPLGTACLPNGADPAPVQALCTRFVTNNGLFRSNGDIACCTPGGKLRGDLGAAQTAQCATLGFTGDEACVAPDACREICGPRCQAFKQALYGFKYAIHWYAQR